MTERQMDLHTRSASRVLLSLGDVLPDSLRIAAGRREHARAVTSSTATAPGGNRAPPPAAPVSASKAAVPTKTVRVSALPPTTSTAASSTVAPPDRDAVEALLARARTYLASGDVAAARLTLRRAAGTNDPLAALTLGGTYDPTVLKRLGIADVQADAAQARWWYSKAAELGSPDAASRLDQLPK